MAEYFLIFTAINANPNSLCTLDFPRTGIRVKPKLAFKNPKLALHLFYVSHRFHLKITFVYYGDINNRILIQDYPKLKQKMGEVNGNWYVRPGYYDGDLQRMLERPSNQFSEKDYEEWIQDV